MGRGEETTLELLRVMYCYNLAVVGLEGQNKVRECEVAIIGAPPSNRGNPWLQQYIHCNLKTLNPVTAFSRLLKRSKPARLGTPSIGDRLASTPVDPCCRKTVGVSTGH